MIIDDMGELQSQTSPEGGFHLFSHLPAEIRHVIWEFALPRPKVISIHATRGSFAPFLNHGRRFDPMVHVYTDKIPVPVVLQVNHESRHVALRHYQLIFNSNPTPSTEWEVQHPEMIYCDLEKDIIDPQRRLDRREGAIHWSSEFDRHVFVEQLPQDVLQRIRSFIMPYTWDGRKCLHFVKAMNELLYIMPNLRVFVVRNTFSRTTSEGMKRVTEVLEKWKDSGAERNYIFKKPGILLEDELSLESARSQATAVL